MKIQFVRSVLKNNTQYTIPKNITRMTISHQGTIYELLYKNNYYYTTVAVLHTPVNHQYLTVTEAAKLARSSLSSCRDVFRSIVPLSPPPPPLPPPPLLNPPTPANALLPEGPPPVLPAVPRLLGLLLPAELGIVELSLRIVTAVKLWNCKSIGRRKKRSSQLKNTQLEMRVRKVIKNFFTC